MYRFALVIFLAACSRSAPTYIQHNDPLITHCSSSAECTSNPDGCRYCFGGQCSCTLPAEPIRDAGVDAPVGTIAREVSGHRIR